MANKKLLVSSDDGKNKEVSISISGSNDNILSASNITINTASIGFSNGIVQIVNGQLETINASVTDYKLQYNGNKFITYESTEAADLGGDLKSTQYTPQIKSLSNVTGGVLSPSRGGTGASSFTSGSLVTTNGSGPAYISNADKIVAVNNLGNLILVDKNTYSEPTINNVTVYLYTGSAASDVGGAVPNATFIWQKPSGCKFIKVICQGGGGGGGVGRVFRNAPFYGPGGGGAGGGYSEVIFGSYYIPSSLTITVGSAGNRGIAGIRPYAVGGGSSGFGGYLVAYGGNPGLTWDSNTAGNTLPYAAGGGGGFSLNGAAGGINFGAGVSITQRFGGAGGGSGGASGGTVGGIAGGSAGTQPNVQAPDSNLVSLYGFFPYYLNNILQNTLFPQIVSTGGGGGYSVGGNLPQGYGGNSLWGSGGGGGGGSRSATTAYSNESSGGNGGKGYVLIICW